MPSKKIKLRGSSELVGATPWNVSAQMIGSEIEKVLVVPSSVLKRDTKKSTHASWKRTLLIDYGMHGLHATTVHYLRNEAVQKRRDFEVRS